MAALDPTVPLTGLSAAPPLALGAARFVPLVRPHVAPGALRLLPALRGEVSGRGDYHYTLRGDELTDVDAFVPHALVAARTDTGVPLAVRGVQLLSPARRRALVALTALPVRLPRRAPPQLLPATLASEGLLGAVFDAPPARWTAFAVRAEDASREAREQAAELRDALRLFEVHEGQVGLLAYAGDALLAGFVVPHPDDYRALHRGLIEDLWGASVAYYARMAGEAPAARAALGEWAVSSVADLVREHAALRARWTGLRGAPAGGLLPRAGSAPVPGARAYGPAAAAATAQPWRRTSGLGPHTIERFCTDLASGAENHVGERIVRADGALEYLSLVRLSEAQARRARLVRVLAEANWNLDAAAAAMASGRAEFWNRLRAGNLTYLVENEPLPVRRPPPSRRR